MQNCGVVGCRYRYWYAQHCSLQPASWQIVCELLRIFSHLWTVSLLHIIFIHSPVCYHLQLMKWYSILYSWFLHIHNYKVMLLPLHIFMILSFRHRIWGSQMTDCKKVFRLRSGVLYILLNWIEGWPCLPEFNYFLVSVLVNLWGSDLIFWWLKPSEAPRCHGAGAEV